MRNSKFFSCSLSLCVVCTSNHKDVWSVESLLSNCVFFVLCTARCLGSWETKYGICKLCACVLRRSYGCLSNNSNRWDIECGITPLLSEGCFSVKRMLFYEITGMLLRTSQNAPKLIRCEHLTAKLWAGQLIIHLLFISQTDALWHRARRGTTTFSSVNWFISDGIQSMCCDHMRMPYNKPEFMYCVQTQFNGMAGVCARWLLLWWKLIRCLSIHTESSYEMCGSCISNIGIWIEVWICENGILPAINQLIFENDFRAQLRYSSFKVAQ